MRARLLLLGAALAAFGGSLVAGFHLDDYAIFSGPLLKPVLWPHPLTRLTFWLNYQAGGQDPLGYHAVNLLLHLGAVLLAYECLRGLLPPTAAFVAAAVFAVHPLQAEAVNYVAMRGVMLAAIFCFAALLAWTEDRPWLAVAAFAAALAADEQCSFFPAVLLFLRPGNRFLTGRPPGPAPERAVFRAVPRGHAARGRFATIALACMVALATAAVWRTHPGSNPLPLPTLRSLRLLVLPWGFTVDPDVHEPMWLTMFAPATFAAAAGWHWRRASPKPNLHSAVAWLLAGLVLLIGNFGSNPAADPRMYLPMFAFAAAAGLLLARIPMRPVAIGLVVVLAAVSVSRTYVWMSDERLWREAVRRAPDKVGPKIQLAKSLRAADALELLNRARQQAPYNPEIPAEIGRVLLDEQQFDGALDELSRAVALNPKNALAFNNRGVALAALGQSPAARTDFEHALALEPDLAEARENLKRLGAR